MRAGALYRRTAFAPSRVALSREGLPAAASADWRQRADALPPSFYEAAVDRQAPLSVVVKATKRKWAPGRSRAAFYSR